MINNSLGGIYICKSKQGKNKGEEKVAGTNLCKCGSGGQGPSQAGSRTVGSVIRSILLFGNKKDERRRG